MTRLRCRLKWIPGAVVAVAAIVSASPVVQGHIDAFLYRDGPTSLRAAGYAFGGSPSVLTEYVVFAEQLSYLPGVAPGVAFGSSPGWNALALPIELPAGGMTLAGLSDVRVTGMVLPTIASGTNLGYWSGSGAPSFGPVPAGEVLQQAGASDPFGGGASIAVHDGSSSPTSVLIVGDTNPAGALHSHPSYAIYGNASRSSTSADAPTPGIYLVALEASMDGTSPANPVYVLFSHQASNTALSAASAYVTAQIVPEPASLFIVGALGVAALRRARRR